MLPFIPRKVAQKSRSTRTPVSRPPQALNDAVVAVSEDAQTPADIENVSHPTNKGKTKHPEGYKDEDLAILVTLAMSEQTLWSDPSLRRKLEASDEGYIPLTYLMVNSPYLSNLNPPLSEAILVKAIRSRLEDTFDVRVLMSSPTRADWYGKASTSRETLGGYEVRLKDWKKSLQRARNMSRNDWEAQTLYMENIPFQHRSVAAISRFTSTLLGDSSNVVQCVTLPRHHQDQPGEQPKCKGFALITLSSSSHLETLLTRWPWNRNIDTTTTDVVESEASREARRFGFRTISKSQWNKLNEEYLSYKQSLLQEIAQEVEEYGSYNAPEDRGRQKRPATPSSDDEFQPEDGPPGKAVATLSSPYPLGCLLFVRNVHPETNKTTLKTLFSATLNTSETGVEGIDYVDFNKGMDSCYLRVATPDHAGILIEHFSSTCTMQASGLDSAGTKSEPGNGGGKPITVELVQGTREELYWGKVPEKVRRAAVEKAVKGVDAAREPGGGENKGKRKRRRK